MRTVLLATAITVGLGQASFAAQPAIIEESVRATTSQDATPTHRYGLSGPVSQSSLDRLASGERVPVIVMLDEPKAEEGFRPGSQSTMDARIARIAEARETALQRAFGVNGFDRRSARGNGRSNRATVMREFRATPGFSAMVSANEIERLRTTAGVAGVYEDGLSEPSLTTTTQLTGAQAAWSQGIEGAGMSIAILDSGIDLDHPMTGSAVRASACFNQIVDGVSQSFCPGGVDAVTDISSGSVGDACVEDNIDPVNGVDQCSHGTTVGSIAAGRTTPDVNGPASGVARQADMIAVNIFAKFGWPNCGFANTCIRSWESDQIAALDWLYANHLELDLAAINMSLGGELFASSCDATDPRTAVINNLRAAGIATVIASGNNGSISAVSAPGCISSAITVGATTNSDAVASFSNSSALVDFLAPGSRVRAAWQSELPAPGESCIASGSATAPGEDGYCHWFTIASGTSMATPHVAGAFAMLRAAFPEATVTDIEEALTSTGVTITDGRNGVTVPRIQIDATHALLRATFGGPENDSFANAIAIAGRSLTLEGSNANAGKEAGDPDHAQAGGASVWWSWTADRTRRPVVIDTEGSNFDTLLAVYTGNSVDGLTPVEVNDDVRRNRQTS